MNFIGTIKYGGVIYTDVDSHNCVQYTLENRRTAEVALIQKRKRIRYITKERKRRNVIGKKIRREKRIN
jgi:hypothetical protein